MSREKKTSGDYDVGYGKPPKHTRFKKGQSGNPKGRPKGSRNFSSDVKKILKQPVRVSTGGKTKTVSTQFAALQRLREKALNGNDRPLDRLFDFARAYNDEELAEEVNLSQSDAEILAGFLARQIREAEEPDAAGECDEPESAEPRKHKSEQDGDDDTGADEKYDV